MLFKCFTGLHTNGNALGEARGAVSCGPAEGHSAGEKERYEGRNMPTLVG